MVQYNIAVQTCAVQYGALWLHMTVEQLRCGCSELRSKLRCTHRISKLARKEECRISH